MERVKDPEFPGFLLEREQGGLEVLHKVFDGLASFLDDDVALGFQTLFLGQNAAGILRIELAAGFERSPVRRFIQVALLARPGGNRNEDARRDGIGKVGIVCSG